MQLHLSDPPQPPVQVLEWCGSHLRILDQRGLPSSVCWIECHTLDQAAAAIADGVVQDGDAIGLVAAYGIALAARDLGQADDWAAALAADVALLAEVHPSSAHLQWVLGIFNERLQRLRGTLADVPQVLVDTAISLHASDVDISRATGRLAVQVMRRHGRRPNVFMTLGNAGSAIRAAHAAGLVEQVYLFAGDTPGAMQLAHWELSQDEVPVAVRNITAAGHLMRDDRVDWLVVGAQRIAANGDVINDMGTYSLAILAMHHGLRFMVVAASSVFDLTLENADEVGAEDALLQRDGALALDVTPAELIDVIVTERGVIERPDENAIAELLSPQRLH